MAVYKTYIALLFAIILTSFVTANGSEDSIRYVEPGMFRDLTYLDVDNATIRFVNGHSGFYLPGKDSLVHEITLSPYRTDASSGLPFIVDQNDDRRILLLRNRELAHIVIETVAEPNGLPTARSVFSGVATNLYETLSGFSLHFTDVEVSSYLREGSIAYGVENLRRNGLQEPWVEGVPGHGIGEFIEFDLSSEAELEVGTFNGIYVYNGFIDYDRPHLYHQNSRVQRFLVRDLTTNEEWTVELEDTPHPQIIEMEGREHHRIQLVIDEVYPGSRYDDTCVASIVLRGFYPD